MRLVERLAHNRHRPLTLISAPAGYGKTVLASMWLDSCAGPSAWVSLDQEDNDLYVFVRYLLAAPHSAFPALELKPSSLLAVPALPPAPVLARHLLNDLGHIPEPFILALDDVHLIEGQAVLELLSELLRDPSQAMHLVLIGRRDPPLAVAWLRGHRQVTEVRAGDLRFTPLEAARLLGQVLHREIDNATATERCSQPCSKIAPCRLWVGWPLGYLRWRSFMVHEAYGPKPGKSCIWRRPGSGKTTTGTP
jgi:LuxR family maltose regulon positive regulatory protein